MTRKVKTKQQKVEKETRMKRKRKNSRVLREKLREIGKQEEKISEGNFISNWRQKENSLQEERKRGTE